MYCCNWFRICRFAFVSFNIKKDRVIGIDIDKRKINQLNLNKSYIERIDNIKFVILIKKHFLY